MTRIGAVIVVSPLVRQLEPERASLAWLGFDAHPAAHRFHTPDDDRQADPGAWKGLGGMEPFEDPEDPLVILRRDAEAVVPHPQPDERLSLLGLDADLRRTAWRHVLQRIAHQIGNDVNERRPVRPNR